VDIEKKNILRLLNKFKKSTSDKVRESILSAINTTHSLLPASALDAVELLVCAPRRYRKSQNQLNFQQTGKVFYIEVLGKKVKGWTWGDSDRNILLLHGWAASGIQFYQFIPILLDAGYKVTIIDCVAHGESEGRKANFFHFYESISTLERVFGKFYGVIAHSLGGSAAFSYFSHRDREDIKLCLVAPGFNLLSVFYDTTESLGLSQSIMSQVIERIENKYHKKLIDYAPVTLISHFTGKVLIVHDSEDRSVLLSRNKQFYSLIKNSSLLITEGLGHIRILKDKATILKCVEFMK
jgi:hypothetical protein